MAIEHVTFNLPIMGTDGGGDCIRLLGESTAVVRDTTIRDTRGVECDRSFVSLQRGLDGVLIERSESVRVGDSAIDFEPTGGVACATILRNVHTRDLVLRKGDFTGKTVTIAGDGCAVVDTVTLADSVIEDGTVGIIDAHNVTLSGLHLRTVDGNPQPALHARDRIANLRVLNSVFERVAGSGPGNAIRVNGSGESRPIDVLLSGIRVLQTTPGPLVETVNLARLVIDDAELVYEGPAVANAAVLVSGANATPVESPHLEDVTVRGALTAAIETAGEVGAPVLIRVTGP